jgi:hypothetical protein
VQSHDLCMPWEAVPTIWREANSRVAEERS